MAGQRNREENEQLQDNELTRQYHKVFLWIALPIGLMYVFLSPAFQVPDEHTHLFRIYHLSEGGLLATKVGDVTGAPLPRSLPTTTFIYTIGIFEKNDGIITRDIIDATLDIPLVPDDTAFVAFSNTALYSPIPYIPQTLAVLAGRLVQAQPLVLLYIGRLANFLTAILLLTLAMKMMPFFKPVLLMVLLTPTSMYQLASLSADALTIAFSVLFIAITLQAAYGKSDMTPKRLFVTLELLAIGICLSKSAYFLIPFLVFIVPLKQFGKSAIHKKIIIVTVGIAFLGLWSFLVKDIYSPSYNFSQIDTEGAKDFMLESPWRYLQILVYSIGTDGWSYILNFVGIQDWDLRVLPDWLSTFYALGIVFAAAIPFGQKTHLPPWHKFFVSVLPWISLVVILTIVYITWSPPGLGHIVGMQGRYLIPLIPLFLLPLYNVIRVKGSIGRMVAFAAPVVSAATLITALIINYVKFYAG